MMMRVRPVPVSANAARGRSNRRQGLRWMTACTEALRRNGWPSAEVVPSHGRSDISGCGDIGVECKDEQDWRNLAAHILQARQDIEERNLPTYVVWRKRRGIADAMEGYCVIGARDFWAERRRVEELERVVLEYSSFLERLRAQDLKDGAGI